MNDKEFNQFHKKCYPYCISRLERLIIPKQNAEDYFQEAIIKYWQYTKQGKIKHQTNPKAYVFVIAKFKWIADCRKKGSIIPTKDEYLWSKMEQQVCPNEVAQFNQMIKQEEEELEKLTKQANMAKLNGALAKLKERCKKLLIERIVNHTPIKEIVKQFSFRNNQVARNTISRCKKKLKEFFYEE